MVILRIVDGGGSVFKFERGGRGLDVGAGLFAFCFWVWSVWLGFAVVVLVWVIGWCGFEFAKVC